MKPSKNVSHYFAHKVTGLSLEDVVWIHHIGECSGEAGPADHRSSDGVVLASSLESYWNEQRRGNVESGFLVVIARPYFRLIRTTDLHVALQ